METKTNVHKTKEQIILELLISLNKGNHGYNNSMNIPEARVNMAVGQYNALVRAGVIVEGASCIV